MATAAEWVDETEQRPAQKGVMAMACGSRCGAKKTAKKKTAPKKTTKKK